MSYRLRNNLIRNPAGKIKYRRFHPNGYDHYHIGVWLEADSDRELDRVESVEYRLHPTFRNRIRRSSNRGNAFSITFWSWGTFVIEATIQLVGGGTVEIRYQLAYDLPVDDSEYVDVSS